MRLIDTSKLELVYVPDDSVPKYAILSHTWGADEVTLQEFERMKSNVPGHLDVHKQTIAKKDGYTKIKQAAALASQRGFGHLWVDTCCIDKTSSAELSEAINSMYLWYQRSEECYAILSDVLPASDEDWSQPTSSLRQSRWFTRGWTLQELIAPKLVIFFAKDWTLLGQKDQPEEFTKIISEVTRVNCEVLDGRVDALQLSVSARMTWASKRQTTRQEDTAYSLMGLFQVNMPLLYGEGTRAFTRLQEEILKRSDDQSLFAWSCLSEDDDPDQLSSLLATSPEEFLYSGDIQPLPPLPAHASMPSSMTNQGLHIQLYLRPAMNTSYQNLPDTPMEEDYDAILDCFIRVNDSYLCPVIHLRRLSEDQYGRIRPSSRRLLPPPQPDLPYEEDIGYRAIYIRQEPMYYHLPQFRVPPMLMDLPHDVNAVTTSSSPYKFSAAFPSRQWNSYTSTLKASYSRKLQAMGLFRFQSNISKKEELDVVVGLRRLNSMQWEGWCFQILYKGASLEESFKNINEKIAGAISATRGTDISPALLRDTVGDDSRLMTDAAVQGVEIQGRLYVSLLIENKPEAYSEFVILTAKQKRKVQEALDGINEAGLSAAEEAKALERLHKEVRELTGPCFQVDWKEFLPRDPGLFLSSFNPRAVRGVVHPIKEPNTEIGFNVLNTNFVATSLSNTPTLGGSIHTNSDRGFTTNSISPEPPNTQATLSGPFEPIEFGHGSDDDHQSPVKPSMKRTTTHRPLEDGFFAENLKEYIARVKKNTPTPVEAWAIALFEGNVAQARMILEKNPEFLQVSTASITCDKYGLHGLHWAIAGGFDQSLEFLLEKAGNVVLSTVSSGGLGPLHIAALQTNSVWKLIRSNVDSESFGELAAYATDHLGDTPLHLLAAHSRQPSPGDTEEEEYPIDMLELAGELMRHQSTACRNVYDETPVHRAAACNNSLMIRLLMAKTNGQHVIDTLDRYGRSPVWHAAATGSFEAVLALVELGANVNLPDDLGMSPLHAACRGGHHRVVAALVESGVWVTAETMGLNFTGMDYAAMFGHSECLNYLLHATISTSNLPTVTSWMIGGDLPMDEPPTVRIRTMKSRALHISASTGWLDCVKLLHSNGADKSVLVNEYVKLDNSKTFATFVEEASDAIGAASLQGHPDIIRYLESPPAEQGSDTPHQTSPGNLDDARTPRKSADPYGSETASYQPAEDDIFGLPSDPYHRAVSGPSEITNEMEPPYSYEEAPAPTPEVGHTTPPKQTKKPLPSTKTNENKSSGGDRFEWMDRKPEQHAVSHAPNPALPNSPLVMGEEKESESKSKLDDSELLEGAIPFVPSPQPSEPAPPTFGHARDDILWLSDNDGPTDAGKAYQDAWANHVPLDLWGKKANAQGNPFASAAPNSGGFGQNTSGGFGQSDPFGVEPDNSNKPPLFGSTTPAPSSGFGQGSLFGAAPGSSDKPTFGSTQPSSGFGQSTPFGGGSEKSDQQPFGTKPATGGFGQSNPFGDQNKPSQQPYGTTPASSGSFGQGSLFGARPSKPDQPLFGAKPSSSSGFDQGSLFGNVPSKSDQQPIGSSTSPSGSFRPGSLFGAEPGKPDPQSFKPSTPAPGSFGQNIGYERSANQSDYNPFAPPVRDPSHPPPPLSEDQKIPIRPYSPRLPTMPSPEQLYQYPGRRRSRASVRYSAQYLAPDTDQYGTQPMLPVYSSRPEQTAGHSTVLPVQATSRHAYSRFDSQQQSTWPYQQAQQQPPYSQQSYQQQSYQPQPYQQQQQQQQSSQRPPTYGTSQYPPQISAPSRRSTRDKGNNWQVLVEPGAPSSSQNPWPYPPPYQEPKPPDAYGSDTTSPQHFSTPPMYQSSLMDTTSAGSAQNPFRPSDNAYTTRLGVSSSSSNNNKNQWSTINQAAAGGPRQSTEERLLTMLGRIGNKSLLASAKSFPTPDLRYDGYKAGFVRREAASAQPFEIATDGDGLPVYELPGR